MNKAPKNVEDIVKEIVDELVRTRCYFPNEPIYAEETRRLIKDHKDFLRTSIQELLQGIVTDIQKLSGTVPNYRPRVINEDDAITIVTSRL